MSVPVLGNDTSATIMGSFVLTVPNASALAEDMEAKAAIAAGVADAFVVPAAYVTVIIKPWSGKMLRRLSVNDKTVTVEYTLKIPADATLAMKAEGVKRAMKGISVAELTEAVQKRVTAVKGADYHVSVNSQTKPTIGTATEKPSVKSTTSHAVLQWRFTWMYQVWTAMALCFASFS